MSKTTGDCWQSAALRRSRAASFGVWLLLYSIILVPLNVLIKTDSPRQPGDRWRDLGKMYAAACLAWLVIRWNDRIDDWCKTKSIAHLPSVAEDCQGKHHA